MNEINLQKLNELVKLLDFKMKQRSGSLIWGQRASIFKGQGMEYTNLRPYQHGDDIRYIDWKVTAKVNNPYIREFEQESELTSLVLADTSSSMFFGHGNNFKYHKMMEVLSVIGLMMINEGDRIGLVYQNEDKEIMIPPGKDVRHLKILLKKLAEVETKLGRENNIERLINYAVRKQYKRGGVVIISDFINEIFSPEKIINSLKKLLVKNEVYLVQILDKYEKELITLDEGVWRDIESEESFQLDIDEGMRQRYEETMKRQIDDFHAEMKKLGIKSTVIMSDQDAIDGVMNVFNFTKVVSRNG